MVTRPPERQRKNCHDIVTKVMLSRELHDLSHEHDRPGEAFSDDELKRTVHTNSRSRQAAGNRVPATRLTAAPSHALFAVQNGSLTSSVWSQAQSAVYSSRHSPYSGGIQSGERICMSGANVSREAALPSERRTAWFTQCDSCSGSNHLRARRHRIDQLLLR